MKERRCRQAAAPFWSVTWPRQRLMPCPAPSRERGCKVGARQRTRQPHTSLVRGGRCLPAARFTSASAVGGPPLPSYLPVPYDLLRGNMPRTVCTASARKGWRPDRWTLHGLAPRPRVQEDPAQQFGGLVRDGYVPRGRQRSLVRGARSRLPPSCNRGVVRGGVPRDGLARWRPPSPPASCRDRRPPAPSLPPCAP